MNKDRLVEVGRRVGLVGTTAIGFGAVEAANEPVPPIVIPVESFRESPEELFRDVSDIKFGGDVAQAEPSNLESDPTEEPTPVAVATPRMGTLNIRLSPSTDSEIKTTISGEFTVNGFAMSTDGYNWLYSQDLGGWSRMDVTTVINPDVNLFNLDSIAGIPVLFAEGPEAERILLFQTNVDPIMVKKQFDGLITNGLPAETFTSENLALMSVNKDGQVYIQTNDVYNPAIGRNNTKGSLVVIAYTPNPRSDITPGFYEREVIAQIAGIDTNKAYFTTGQNGEIIITDGEKTLEFDWFEAIESQLAGTDPREAINSALYEVGEEEVSVETNIEPAPISNTEGIRIKFARLNKPLDTEKMKPVRVFTEWEGFGFLGGEDVDVVHLTLTGYDIYETVRNGETLYYANFSFAFKTQSGGIATLITRSNFDVVTDNKLAFINPDSFSEFVLGRQYRVDIAVTPFSLSEERRQELIRQECSLSPADFQNTCHFLYEPLGTKAITESDIASLFNGAHDGEIIDLINKGVMTWRIAT